jgi:8-oxo-dGTP pyrophosphatase MutT (NUDIX family)
MVCHAENIKQALQKTLPGSSSHRKMLPPNRLLTAATQKSKYLKRSSVLLLLFEENKELFACLIKRPKHMKYHAGQIALPGGRIEEGETALETALRETHEEIGISPEKITILGSLSELYVAVSQFLINPFVGWLDKKPEFSINHDEVEKTVIFPLLRFNNIFEEVELETVTGQLKVPCIRYNDEIIWGATAMILSEFYDILNE